MPWNLEISLSANTTKWVNNSDWGTRQEKKEKLEEKKCGDYFVSDKWPKTTRKECQESLLRAWGAVCQKALPCPHWTPVSESFSIYICTKKAAALTKAFLSHGDFQTALYSSQGIVGKGC